MTDTATLPELDIDPYTAEPREPAGLRRRKFPWQITQVYRQNNCARHSPSSRDISRKFKMHGTFTSAAEVTHVSKHGFWLLLNGEELLVPFSEFPWFKKATIEQLSTVEWPSANHLYWPQLDVDLSVESIRNPGAFPLMAKAKS